MQKKLISVCELGRIGDIVTSEPIFRYLKKSYPDRALRWYTRPAYAELLRYSPDVDEVVTVKDKAEYLALKEELPPDTLCFELNFGAAAGQTVDRSSPPLSLLTQFSLAAGLPPLDETPCFHFKPDLPPSGLPEKYVVFHCASNGKSRQWPSKNWEKLAGMFLNAGWHVVEIGIFPVMSLTHPNFISMTGKMDLQSAAGIIRDAKLLVGVESGFGHIANAVGINAIIISGKLKKIPEYCHYSGRFRKGTGCNIVSFYNQESDLLPFYVAAEVVGRYIAGNQMTAEECRIFCLREQVRSLQSFSGGYLMRTLRLPFEKIRRAVVFHNIRHKK